MKYYVQGLVHNVRLKKQCERRRSSKKYVKVGLLKMLAVMEAGSQGAGPSGAGSSSPSDPPIQEFLTSGRTGRRNALPDILGQHAVVTSSDLPSRLQALTTKDQGPSSPSNPSEPQPGPSSAQS